MRSWKQRLCSLLLCAAVLVSLCPTALAEDGSISYLDENGDEQLCKAFDYVSQSNPMWENGVWYVAKGQLDIQWPVTVKGNVHLILVNSCELKATRGINVSEGNSLTIYAQPKEESAMGKLEAYGDYDNITASAGIGGYEGSGGTITINGGNVTATGYNGGAGIGGGYGGSGGNITINEGNVAAFGNNGGAGIGGGSKGGGGTITISGGTVKVSGKNSADIGGGNNAKGDAILPSDKIEISESANVTHLDGKDLNIGPVHEVNTDEWGSDSTSHWRPCKIENCDKNHQFDKNAHSFGDWMIDIPATSDKEGQKHRDCSICKYLETETIPPVHSHSYGAEWNSDASGHWHECSCGDRSDYVPHNPGGWIVDQAATSSTAGRRHRECTACGYWTQTETIPPVHSHSYGREWKSNAAGHWHECSCGARSGYAAHSFGDWTIDTPATSTTKGSRYRDCSICQYRETETVPPVHSHSYGDEWKSNAAGHWHECSCGARSGYAAHSFGEWTIDTPATSTTKGSRYRDCNICQYRQTETVPPTYKPDVTQPDEGGTVSVTPSRPERGDTVTIKPKPDEGYELDSITVTDRDGKSVELTAKPDGTYTFQQPSGKVKIEVTYKRVETPWNNPFADVSERGWYYEAVRFAQERGLMNGYSNGRFGANDTLSRAQLAQILFNKEGRPGVDYLLDFSDVGGRSWYAEAVRWAASQGIVSGYGNGTFGPNDPITREQLAVMLWRYSGSPAAASKELDFNDESQISGYALEAMRWAVENGILNGYGDGRLGPKGQATRAQAAQILKNFIGNRKDDT